MDFYKLVKESTTSDTFDFVWKKVQDIQNNLLNIPCTKPLQPDQTVAVCTDRPKSTALCFDRLWGIEEAEEFPDITISFRGPVKLAFAFYDETMISALYLPENDRGNAP